MNDTLSARVEERCGTFQGRVATYDSSGAPVTFEKLFLTMLSFAQRLEDRGVGAGDRISIEINDAILAMLLRLALLRLGAVVFPSSADEMESNHGLAVDWRLHGTPRQDGTERDILFDETWMVSPSRIVPISGKGLIVRSTSGTTGTPKLRVVDEAGLLARIDHGLRFRGTPDGPVFNGYRATSSPGVNMFLRVLNAGQPQIFQQATPELTLDEMDRLEAVIAYLPPFGFNRILETAIATGKRPKNLRKLVVGGGAISPGTAIRAETHFGATVQNAYGSNETGSMASYRIAETPQMSGVVGKLYEGYEIEFFDDEGNRVAAETGGEFRVRVPEELRVHEYPSMVPICDSEGWVSTGDIGIMLADEKLRLIGRKSDVINIGGTKRAPGFFEDIARKMPFVKEALAFRAPVENGMDHVGLAVVPALNFDLSEFGNAMIARLGPTFPLHVTVVDVIPENAAGKFDRMGLTQSFIAAQAGHAKD